MCKFRVDRALTIRQTIRFWEKTGGADVFCGPQSSDEESHNFYL